MRHTASPDSTIGRTIFVDGTWRSSESSFTRVDPSAPGIVTGTFAAATQATVSEAFDCATQAQIAWSHTPAPLRATVLQRAATLLENRVDAAAETLTSDMGKAIGDARMEVLRSAAIFRYFAGELLGPVGEIYPSLDPQTQISTLDVPLGVVCAITPWNFPFAIPAWKIAPAIAFGNAVVWKPAEAASGSAVFLSSILQQAGLPAGVLNLVTGKGRQLSPALIGDPRVAAVTFTGSNSVGSHIRHAVSDRNVKVQLELGGKNPAIVLPDADLTDAAVQICRGAMLGTGQRCTATSRVYVHTDAADEFTDALRAQVSRLVVGDPHDPRTTVGPLASLEQYETVTSYLRLAEREGAQTITGGSPHPTSAPHENGYFVTPTVLSAVAQNSRLMREEIFGPVLILTPVDSFDEALTLANSTEFGLSSAVFTTDVTVIQRFIRDSQSGLVHVNRETASVEPHVPFGGIKASSSMAREQGRAARAFFTTSKTVYLRTPAL